MTKSAEVLCEGYYDRDFIAGWLESRGWTDPGRLPSGERGVVIHPTTASRIVGGQFAFKSPNGTTFLVVRPTGGGSKLLPAVESTLRQSVTKPLEHLLVVSDLDVSDGGPIDPALGGARAALEAAVHRADPGATGPGPWLTRGSLVDLIVWHSQRPVCEGVPTKQTLERLVCHALAAAYAARGTSVEAWLAGRPDKPAVEDGKSWAWSFMAGWWPSAGRDSFLRLIWNEPPVANELASLMDDCGASAAIARLET